MNKSGDHGPYLHPERWEPECFEDYAKCGRIRYMKFTRPELKELFDHWRFAFHKASTDHD